MDWVFDSFSIQAALDTDLTIAEIPVRYSSDTDTLQLYPNDSMMTLLPSTSDGTVTQKYFHLPDYVCAPIQQGDVVGTVELKLAGETIGVVDLIAGQDVARNPLLFGVDKVKEFFTSLYLKVVLVLSLIAALIYGLWLLCANWNHRKPTKRSTAAIEQSKAPHRMRGFFSVLQRFRRVFLKVRSGCGRCGHGCR